MQNFTYRSLPRAFIVALSFLLLQIPQQRILGSDCIIGERAFFSPDEKFFISTIQPDEHDSHSYEIAVWDVATAKIVRTFTPESKDGKPFPTSIDISPDGKYLVGGYVSGESVLWEINTGKPLQTFHYPSEAYLIVKFSPNGQYVLGYGLNEPDGMILWNALTGAKIHTFPPPGDWFTFSPSSDYLLIQYDDDAGSHVALWEVATGIKLNTFTLASHGAVSPDNQLVVANHVQTIIFWDVNKKKELKTISLTDAQVDDLFLSSAGADGDTFIPEFSSNGKYLLLRGDGGASIWSVSTRKQMYVIDGGAGFSQDGKYLIVSKFDPSYTETKRLIVQTLDVKTGKAIQTSYISTKDEYLLMSPRGVYIAALHPYTIELWEVRTGKLLRTLTC